MNNEFLKYSKDLIDNMSVDELETRLKEFGFIVERIEKEPTGDGQSTK